MEMQVLLDGSRVGGSPEPLLLHIGDSLFYLFINPALDLFYTQTYTYLHTHPPQTRGLFQFLTLILNLNSVSL